MAQQHHNGSTKASQKASQKNNGAMALVTDKKKAPTKKGSAQTKAFKKAMRKLDAKKMPSSRIVAVSTVPCRAGCNCVTCLITKGDTENQQRVQRKSSSWGYHYG